MSHAIARSWTADEFFAWQERQPERYELVGGQPVRLMTGVRSGHDIIVVNLVGELRQQLRGSGCRPFTGEWGIETIPGQIRRPDVGADCGPFTPQAFTASAPRLVVDVLSPSTRDFDTFGKVEEYKRVDAIDYILLVEPNAPEVVLWSRGEDRGWAPRTVEGRDATVPLPALGIELAMAEIYEGVEFPVAPRLVLG